MTHGDGPEQERRFQAVFESALDAIVIMDDDARFLEANPSACALFGLERKQLLTRRLPEFVPDRALFEQNWQRSLRDGFVKGQGELMRADGSVRVVHFAATSSFQPGCHLSVLRDVTEARHSEQALSESEQRYRVLFESNPQPIFVADRATLQILAVNEAAVREYGYSHAEFTSMTIKDLRPPEDVPDLLARLSNAASIDERGPWRHRRKDGTLIQVKVDRSAFVWSGRSAWLGVVTDVTEHQRLEDQLRQAQKMEAVGTLAGGVAHDFNNLLMVVNGYGEQVVRQLPAGDPLRHKVEQILRAGERAAALTRQLLAFSRKQVLELRVLNLNAVVNGLEKMLRRLIGEHIDMIVLPGRDLERVRADAGQVEQVIMNLVVNARDAMPQGGTIRVEVENVSVSPAEARAQVGLLPGSYVMLTVADTGVGMDAETLSRIFEPFFTTKAAGKGTGLGLSTVYGIVKQFRGYVGVTSAPRQGSTFRVYLPTTEEPLQPRVLGQPSARVCAASATVLVTEDDSTVRELVCSSLVEMGHTVLEARHSGEAVEICERYKGPIDLLLTDVVMPQMNGQELARRVKAARPGVRTLYMSGYADPDLLQDLAADGQAFLPKPFTIDHLASKVHDVLTSAEGTRQGAA